MITLGIIGVVAAMTIPNLIANAQKKSVVSGLQEAQSILNQAVKMYSYESDEEGTGDFDTSLDSKSFAKKYFEPYLKVARVCENKSDGCWKTENFYGYYDLGMNRKTDTIKYSLVLNNGMIVGFGKIDGTNLHSIIVDINGQGRRNVMGKDVFVFYPFNSEALCEGYNKEKAKMIKNGIYPGSFDNCGVPHVIFSREDILAPNKLLRACNKDVAPDGGGRTGAGSACAALIFKDGWKISRDYPWK